MDFEFDQQTFESVMLHKQKEEAVRAAMLLIANSEEGGQLTIHNAVEGFVHKESADCGCNPDVYEIPPKKPITKVH